MARNTNTQKPARVPRSDAEIAATAAKKLAALQKSVDKLFLALSDHPTKSLRARVSRARNLTAAQRESIAKALEAATSETVAAIRVGVVATPKSRVTL